MRRSGPTLFLLFVMFAALLVIGGCSNDKPTQPRDSKLTDTTNSQQQSLDSVQDSTGTPADSLPVGTRIAFSTVLKTIDLSSGVVTFTDKPYTGQTTSTTHYAGMFMSPTITLANFAPGMGVTVVGRIAGNWVLTVDSLSQMTFHPPDSTWPPDTLPVGSPLWFYATISTVDSVSHTITFVRWPYVGQMTESTKVVLSSLILCSSSQDCVWPGMMVDVFGRTTGAYTMIVDSLIEMMNPPDSTFPPPDSTWPPDSFPDGMQMSFDDVIQKIDTATGMIWFTWHMYAGTVTPETYYSGEFPPGTVPTLANFHAGDYVYIKGFMAGHMDGRSTIRIDTLILNDFLPPDSGIIVPPDSMFPPPDSMQPPDSIVPGDSGYMPISGTIFFDINVMPCPDSGMMPTTGSALDLFLRTEELYSCPQVYIAGMVDLQPSSVSFDISGVPPFECFAYQPGPAERHLMLKFETKTFTLALSYQGQTDQYDVTVGLGDVVTVTPVGTPAFTAFKNL